VSFKARSANGSPITSFTATCTSSNGGQTSSSKAPTGPITVNVGSFGYTYTCRVTAANSRGNGEASAASAPVVV
jgi:hypothetical protein